MKKKYLIPVVLAFFAVLSLVLGCVVNSTFITSFSAFIVSLASYFEYLRALKPQDKIMFSHNTLKTIFQQFGALKQYKSFMKGVCIVSAISGAATFIRGLGQIIFS